MKINKKSKKTNKAVYAVVVVVLVVAALFAGYFAYAHYQSIQSSEQNSSTDSDAVDIDGKSNANNTDNDDVDSSLTNEEVPVSDTVSINITKLTSTADEVTYSASVNGAQSGKCSATFTNSIGKPVVKVSDAKNGICSGTYGTSEFDALGQWKLTVHFYTNNTQATASGDVDVN